MKSFYGVLSFFALSTFAAETPMLSVIERGGRAHVLASRLEHQAGIAIKRLPGQQQIVACSGELCAFVTEFIDEEGDLLVPVESLATALHAKPRFDDVRRNVRFELPATLSNNIPARVGRLAPDFRLRKLDGTWVALSDFRGKRVLINSWASW
jgi:hypothetical protein